MESMVSRLQNHSFTSEERLDCRNQQGGAGAGAVDEQQVGQSGREEPDTQISDREMQRHP